MEKERDLIMEIVEVTRIFQEESNMEVFHKEICRHNNNQMEIILKQ